MPESLQDSNSEDETRGLWHRVGTAVVVLLLLFGFVYLVLVEARVQVVGVVATPQSHTQTVAREPVSL